MACIRYGRTGLLLVGLLLFIVGCAQKSDYERVVERELGSGEVHNDLFLGYELGMPRDSFYDHSWDLNRQGLVMQGPQNQTVQYEMEDDLPYPAKMFYYPDFYDDKMYRMRVTFLYDGWAPWNQRLMSDSLQMDVIDLFREWYGDGFIEYVRTQEGFGENVHYVKVDGNRQIMVGRASDSEVTAVITDLAVERKMQKEQQGSDDA